MLVYYHRNIEKTEDVSKCILFHILVRCIRMGKMQDAETEAEGVYFCT